MINHNKTGSFTSKAMQDPKRKKEKKQQSSLDGRSEAKRVPLRPCHRELNDYTGAETESSQYRDQGVGVEVPSPHRFERQTFNIRAPLCALFLVCLMSWTNPFGVITRLLYRWPREKPHQTKLEIHLKIPPHSAMFACLWNLAWWPS